MVLVGLLLFFLSLSAAQKRAYTCSFSVTGDPLFKTGTATGTLRFDWVRHKHDLTYSSGVSQVYSYNANGGYTDTKSQFVFLKTTSCPCSITPLATAQPPLLKDPAFVTLNSDGTYKPTSGNTGYKQITFDAAGYPASATDSDGRAYKFSGCADASFSDSTWNPPSGCECGTPSDVVLVLDRSSSIDAGLFVIEKNFVTDLVAAFTYGPLNTNLGITNFHTLSWDGPVSLKDGVTAAKAKEGASKLACAADAQCHVFESAGTCCGSGTTISAGIINGAQMLAREASKADARKNAAKVLIVFTDGAHGKVISLKPDGSYLLDAAGKVQGGAGGTPAQLTADLQAAVDYAKKLVPGLIIYAVASGPTYDRAQLLVVAGGDASRVFADRDWNALSGFVKQLTGSSCTGTVAPSATTCCDPDSCSAWCKEVKTFGAVTCTDGGKVDGDGCSSKCITEPGFTCSGGTCTAICGDSIILGKEKCDDGNKNNGDGCSSTCQIEDGYSCPAPGKPCTEVCGDKKKTGKEQCDDGNVKSGDGCSATCTTEPGFSCVTVGVLCLPVCGDGLKVGSEACDDGNKNNGDGCSSTCAIEPGYTCPDAPGKPCKDLDECKAYGCGTVAKCTESAGKVVPVGKRVCTCPAGYSVTKLTTDSVTLTGDAPFAGCTPICGDSLTLPPEECDDGDRFDGDGCNSNCKKEDGAVCPDPGLKCCLPLPMEATEPIKCWNGYWIPIGQKRDQN